MEIQVTTCTYSQSSSSEFCIRSGVSAFLGPERLDALNLTPSALVMRPYHSTFLRNKLDLRRETTRFRAYILEKQFNIPRIFVSSVANMTKSSIQAFKFSLSSSKHEKQFLVNRRKEFYLLAFSGQYHHGAFRGHEIKQMLAVHVQLFFSVTAV